MWAASSLAGCAATCCAACACEACKGIAGSISKKSARLAYCGLFTFSLLLAWFFRDYAEVLVDKIPWIASFGLKPSKDWFGTMAVLRVTLGNFLFFFGFSLIMIGVKSQKDARDGWHHGGWMFKFILWIACILLTFFLPASVLGFYGELSKFGSGLFLLVQMIILLDFTYSWNSAWVSKDDNKWYMALLVVSVFCFLATIACAVLMFHWFTPPSLHCELNTFFITFTLLLVIGMATLSLHPEINGSLLPASVIGLYSMYLCWSALSSEPREYECNGLASHFTAVSTTTLAMGCVTTLLSVVYSAVRAGSSSAFLSSSDSSPMGARREPLLSAGGEDESGADSDSESSSRSRDKPVRYVYSFFHLIFALASMYSAMLLTGWVNEGGEGKDIIDVGWPSVWVKIISQWATVVLYVWSLVAPLIFPDRDFF